MDNVPFFEEVRRQFDYLVKDYGFSVKQEFYAPEAFGNAVVELRSSEVGVRVLLDRGQVLVDIGPLSLPPESWFGLPSIVQFIASQAIDSEYIFPESWEDYDVMVSHQIERVANILRKYGTPVVAGSFKGWEEIGKRRGEEGEAEYRMLTGKRPPTSANKTG